MYPVIRMTKELLKFRKAPPLGPLDVHVSTHRCWPWDIDLWMELNNGRTLTLYDLGRIPLARRTGLIAALARQRWGLTMAGASMRWRRRIRMFEKITMHSRCVGWDARFLYLEQTMWKTNGDCANQIVYRSAITGREGIVAPERLIATFETPVQQPVLPEWVQAWIEADALRPWPPERAS